MGTLGCAPSPRSRSVKGIPEGRQMQSELSSFFPVFLPPLLVFLTPQSPSPKEVISSALDTLFL